MRKISLEAKKTSLDYLTFDSEAVQKTYRRTIQRGTGLFCATCLLNAALQYWVNDPWWLWSVVLSVACLPIIPLCSVRRTYWLFFAGLVMISAIIMLYYSFMGLRYGAEAAFHLKLLVAVPVLTMAGRLGLSVKRFVLVLLVLSFVLLDAQIASVGGRIPLTATQLHVIRTINIGLTLCNLAFLLMHYFRLVAEQQVMLETYATTDPLTGLANRRQLSAVWVPIQAGMERHKFPVSIAICDLDHFKSINDRFGHDTGDKVKDPSCFEPVGNRVPAATGT
ncbi:MULTISPECIES: GGDEF domain-containing protein [Hydrocarboniphaga]|jgi:predicted signal transduction protein with EAL and GGDEF domain|uniref:diguanylate cyclase n=1 Tax=Hydrocarboniphaga effusa AP103 TaxID=1172194 RepID=I8T3U3_9GAMM|nr:MULTISPECIES: GGDEF domain-containing protein [Hydrocarboniphaga]EIT68378.1 hypothetical protein WQQ_35730 [Hydrocarboniphaga effusa AP103]MDZ4078631.1 GGDEF domain-containing protein [Hydrocarboniphaga sp.]